MTSSRLYLDSVIYWTSSRLRLDSVQYVMTEAEPKARPWSYLVRPRPRPAGRGRGLTLVLGLASGSASDQVNNKVDREPIASRRQSASPGALVSPTLVYRGLPLVDLLDLVETSR